MTFVILELDDPLENARSVAGWDWPALLDTPNLVGVDAFDSREELEAAIAAGKEAS